MFVISCLANYDEDRKAENYDRDRQEDEQCNAAPTTIKKKYFLKSALYEKEPKSCT
jgi:hypothetical protein